jgi:acetyl-CoA C-acetyltransferase
MKEVLKRANNLDPLLIDEIVVGDCIQCFDEANTAHTAALMAGIPFQVPVYTVQRQCASSMQVLAKTVQQIWSGDADVILIGRVESMRDASPES